MGLPTTSSTGESGREFGGAEDWNGAPLGEVVRHLREQAWKWRDRDAPLIGQLAVEVRGADGRALRRLWMALATDLERDLEAADRVVFPSLLELQASRAEGRACPHFAFGSVRNPISMLRRGHELIAQRLEDLSVLAARCATPALRDALDAFARSFEDYASLERQVLFPRVQKLERLA